jgi:hypothetical protein
MFSVNSSIHSQSYQSHHGQINDSYGYPSLQQHQVQPHHSSASEDILNFEKIFFVIYQHYISEESLTNSIDLTQNMLSLCLNNLLPFCCWARKDSQKSECLHKLLLDNADLRPEVRNGIALIIIYVFASAKEHLETAEHALDMFGVLQDTHRGLGIVHKTSLRIYNDPLNYFSFIKVPSPSLLSANQRPHIISLW